MAVDMFLKLGDIKGESGDDKYKEWIQVESFSWGATQPGGSSHGSGAGVGKVQLQDIHFTKQIDKSSADIFGVCASGKHLKEATIVFRKAGDKPLDYLKIKLGDVLVTGYQTSSGGAGTPMESISLNYTKVDVEYTEQDSTGAPKGTFKTNYDVKANTSK